jgi:hypothetical protein
MKSIKSNFKESFLFKSAVTAFLFSILLGCTSNSDESAEETVATTPEVVVAPLAEPEAAPVEVEEPEPTPEPEPKPAPQPKPAPIVVKQEVAAPTVDKLKTVKKKVVVEAEVEDDFQDVRLDLPEPQELGLEDPEEQEQVVEFDITSDDALVLNGDDDELNDASEPLVADPVEMTDREKDIQLAARVDRALTRLANAKYTFNPKKELVVGEAFEVEAVMQLSSLINQDSGLLPDVESLVGQMKVDEFVHIELEASNSEAVTIVAVSNPDQAISTSFTPKWRWSVLANQEGAHKIFLKVTPFINLENRDGSLVKNEGRKKTIIEDLNVVAKPFNFWDWITTTVGMISAIIAILVVGGLIVVVPNLVSKK